MRLTPLQHNLLQAHQKLKSEQGSVSGLLFGNPKNYVYQLVILFVVVPVVLAGDSRFGLILFGAALGYIARDLRHLYSLKLFWPVLDEIVNWARVDQMLKQGHSETNKTNQ